MQAGLGDTEQASVAPGAQLVVKALNLLDLIGQAPGRHRAQTLARELGLPRSTVYRILTVLQQRQMVRFDQGDAGYHPGFRFLDYAQGVWPLGDLPLLALAELRALAELTGETAYFAVRSGDEMMIIQRVEGAYPSRAGVALGARQSLHGAAPGRAFLAGLPPEERDRAIARLAQSSATERAMIERAQFAAQLDLFRLRRYAIDDEECEPGFRCVGAAAMGEDGTPVGAFGVAGPIFRMTPERAHQWGAEVAAAAMRLSDALRRKTHRARGGAGLIAPLAGYRAAHAKAPIWDSHARQLLWLDALAPALMSLDASGAIATRAVFDAPATALAPLGLDRWFVATANGAHLVSDGATTSLWPDVAPGLFAQASSACVIGDDIWLAVGDAPGAETKAGLYRLGVDGAALIHELDFKATALVAAPAGDALLIVNADAGEILRASLSDRRVDAPRVMTRIDAIRGRPSAIAFDSAGDLWIALWDGWAVARIAPDGAELRLLPLPTPRPAGLAFGGPNDDTLYVVSGRHSLSPQQIADAPESGGLFVITREQRERLLR